MAMTYRFKVSEGPSDKLKKIRDTMGPKGIRFTCNPDGTGSFGGMGLAGNYYREGDEIVLTLITVPPFTTFETVAESIRKSVEGDNTE
ncbi:MAG TPA: hypothetical protein VMW26_03785 [Methanomassiliicoccales archaeon]|nr:hypothetical protein [Methanomassiliicoccales archaeon]